MVAMACQHRAGGFCVAVPLIPGWPASCQRERRNVQRHVRRAGVCLLRLGIILNRAFPAVCPFVPNFKAQLLVSRTARDAFPDPAVHLQGQAGQGAAGLDRNRPCPLSPARSCVEAEVLSCEESYSLWNALIKQAALEEVDGERTSADSLAAP